MEMAGFDDVQLEGGARARSSGERSPARGGRVEKGEMSWNPSMTAGGMDMSGTMDLDDRVEFPVLGKSAGITHTEGVREKDHRNNMEVNRGAASMEGLYEARAQKGKGDADATTLRSGMQGWANVVAGSQDKELDDCPEATIDRSGDEPTVVFPAEACQKMEDIYRFAVVAGFYGGRSSTSMDYRYVFQNLRKLWVNVVCPKFSVIGNGRFLVRVSSEEELMEVLRRKWVVGGRILIASRWKPGTELRLHEEESIPLWVRLPQLPVLFWNSYSFKAIAQGLGASFVRADECTLQKEKLGFARLCINVPLNFQPVAKIKLEAKETKIVQDVLYESRIRFCRVCGTTSHYEDMCKHRGTTLSSSTEAQAWKKVLVPKKAREGIQRSDPGEQRLHANRFATLSNHFH
ncbi:hypothetical protein EJ110_NYTH38385, partial [Nymphaea thermarum]